MNTTQLVLWLIVSFLVRQCVGECSTYYTVYAANNNSTSFLLKQTLDKSGVAWACIENTVYTNGWAFVSVTTNENFPDKVQMRAAGYIEGAITTDLIYANYYNTFTEVYDSIGMPLPLQKWFQANIDYMVSNFQSTDPYWQHVALVWEQLLGMIDGYNQNKKTSQKALNVLDFMMLNSDGDIDDLLLVLGISGIDWNDDKSILDYYSHHEHCSVLISVKDDLTDIFAGHTTWTGYVDLLRTFKTYNFPLKTMGTRSKITTFSSYPGTLSSIDDFYLLDTGLVVMETTNEIFNLTLYQQVTPKSLLSWIRTIVANRLGSDGPTWIRTFSRQNSGTYNNQWIIVDYNKLVSGHTLGKGTLYIAEQLPGLIESGDVTSYLQFGHWPSYNVPFFQNIYDISGYPAYEKRYGNEFSYQSNPRAEIFRRDAGKVESVSDLQKILRYNNWQSDPLSLGSPAKSISCRADLVGDPFGGTDTKVVSSSLVKDMKVWAQSGPTHDELPPFQWSNGFDDVSHMGQPDLWDFDWVLYAPSGSQ